jgi:hypothetical protein
VGELWTGGGLGCRAFGDGCGCVGKMGWAWAGREFGSFACGIMAMVLEVTGLI